VINQTKETSAMSMARGTIGHTGPGQGWMPAFSPGEAVTAGIPRREYDQAFLFARATVKEHQTLGTPRDEWEPTPIVNHKLAAPFIGDGEQELVGRLEKEVNPALDKCHGLLENVKASLDELAERAQPFSTEEAGTSYSAAEAVARIGQHDETIERDEADGKHHHRRASVLLKRLATWAPWLEAVGFLTFITYYLNVPLLQPWQDWLGWSFAVVVVLVIILGQTWLVRHAAKSHNHAREDYASGRHPEADHGFRLRNRYLWLTAVTAAAITAGMIWRGTAALGSASFGTAALMVFAATITGLLLPTLAYLGFALDGSKVSRERDGLAAQMDDDLDAYHATISDSRRDLAEVAETGVGLRDKTFPDICHTTQEAVDGVYDFYATVRLLIGGLKADPPARTTRTIGQDAAGNMTGYIGTSIPATSTVDLQPLFDREHRLDELQTQRADLLDRIDALPQHPWGNSRT
jgi:hypothetical protein